MKCLRVRFSLKMLLIATTLFCLWLAYQVLWLQQRKEALTWITNHETGDSWSPIDPTGVKVTPVSGITSPYRERSVPLAVWLSRSPQVHFISLDKAKLSATDADFIDTLQALFPEANGVHVQEPGWVHRWPPNDREAFFE